MPSLTTRFSAPLALVASLLLASFAGPVRAQSWAPEACDLSGRWAVGYVVPLAWRLNAGLEGGRGELFVGGVLDREALGEGRYVDTLRVCARSAPATRTLMLYGSERYASALDVEGVPFAALPTAQGELTVDADGQSFVAQPLAVLYGLALEQPTRAAFPRNFTEASALALPSAVDGRPGVRLAAQGEGGLRLPPVNARRTRRAVFFDAVLRDVLAAQGTVASCDALHGRASIADVGGKPGLQASLVGCQVEDGSPCVRSELSLVNAFQPAFHPELGQVTMTRIAPWAGCDEALAAVAP